jgi:hypothetical protein
MMARRRFAERAVALVLAAGPLALTVMVACGGPTKTLAGNKKPAALASDKFKNATRCDATKPGHELSYHDLNGHGRADMVEVISYAKNSGGAAEGRVVCMEVDTNRDGVLDLIRTFGDDGGLEAEEADRNYDGKSDVWINYEKGVVSKQAFDSKFSGRADEFHYYKDGKLKRIERDRNADGKIDIWEYYVSGRLERMGVDSDFDGRVNVWYRDEVARAAQKSLTAANAPPPTASAPVVPSAAPSGSVKKKAAEAL